jgi:hypothetical protein
VEKDLKSIKKVSDMFLEEGTNVLIMTDEMLREFLRNFKG